MELEYPPDVGSATWRGPFGSRDEAAAALDAWGSVGQVSLFGTASWLSRQRDFLDLVMRDSSKWEAEPLRRGTTLPMLVATSGAQSVIDFGGGSGWTFALLEALRLNVRDYLIIEREEVCGYFSQDRDAPTYVDLSSWREILAAQPPRCDVVYANSSLQYSESDDDILAVVDDFGPSWVLLDDTLVCNGATDVFALQVNSDVTEIVRFLSLPSLRHRFADLGMDLVHRTPFTQPGHWNWARTTDSDRLPRTPQPESLLFRRRV